MLQKVVSISLFAITIAGSAAAQVEDYCPSSSADCRIVNVSNASGATVNKVNIIQQPTDGACAKDDRTIKREMAPSVEYQVRVNKACKYKVKFKTVSQCTGDKTAYFTPDKFSSGASEVLLHGDCSDLKASIK
jgi:hypothetical protein